jgi:pimeloyl-ACP methyl ester carboxylesterase
VAYVENDGVRIHYQVEGKGLPLFLHMGFSVDLTGWYEWGYVDALKDDYRVILIDPRGHGKSDKPHDPAASSRPSRARLSRSFASVLVLPTPRRLIRRPVAADPQVRPLCAMPAHRPP